MLAQLFNRAKSEVYQLFEWSATNVEYPHTFGGPARHEGTIPEGCKNPIHLFFESDLADPLIEIRPSETKITRLPLYYALGNVGGPLRYRVLSDDWIELLSQPYPAEYRAQALKRYPKPFPREPILLNALGYDAKDPQWLWNYGGILGVGKLSRAEKAVAKTAMERWHQEAFGRPLIDRYDGDEEDPSFEDILAGFDPFTQGTPEAWCPNPQCPEHKKQMLPVLMYLEPEEDDPFYESIAGGDNGQLIWMVCPRCASVKVDNPCT